MKSPISVISCILLYSSSPRSSLFITNWIFPVISPIWINEIFPIFLFDNILPAIEISFVPSSSALAPSMSVVLSYLSGRFFIPYSFIFSSFSNLTCINSDSFAIIASSLNFNIIFYFVILNLFAVLSPYSFPP